MSQFLDAFKIKPFDLDPIFDTWKDAPLFQGNPKKDLPVDEWLDRIKQGCIERKVPRDYWHKVAYHYLGKNAKSRMDEVKRVMKNMHGGKYKWNWKAFKVAMRNMGWDIDPKKTEEYQVESKPSGIWWIVGRNKQQEKEKEDDRASIKSHSSVKSHASSSSKDKSLPRPPAPQKAKSWDMSSFRPFPIPKRSATMSTIETVGSTSSPSSSKNSTASTSLVPSTTTTAVNSPAQTPGETTTTIAQAPTWLVNACQALDFLTGEHPKVMTALSAVLITVGSIPALPAISAGAGGAFLASGTAHAIGSIAVGVGSLLQAIGNQQVQAHGPAQAQTQK
ncbi:hypothetical protein K474DRAFT_1709206 [Panus rudis PR-1116 ss-1]|nr:hypothetical protein K474DRAFT_1709206 [Panus rudis PR-1116 ss-1]